ncbi:hypothetical protein PZE06_21270 [Robertmurraya sp. DFI.2.37]|nr:hypothetical protein [Robertmurraya sp. DFI.2.37]MDF1510669.1 hypothetical protein [Robertmurraya sp. DFI.2.37]
MALFEFPHIWVKLRSGKRFTSVADAGAKKVLIPTSSVVDFQI